MRLFCIAAILISANAIASEKVLLKYNLPVGHRNEYQIKMGMKIGEFGSLSGTFHIAERTLVAKESEIIQKVFFAGSSFVADDELESVKDSFAQMKNFSYEKRMATTGKSTAIAGIPTSSLGSSIELVYSDQPVEVGDTWKSTMTTPQSANQEITFKLVELGDNEAKIEAQFKDGAMWQTLEPYLFIIDRKTGSTKYSRGSIKATVEGTTIDVKYEMRMIVPTASYQFKSGDM